MCCANLYRSHIHFEPQASRKQTGLVASEQHMRYMLSKFHLHHSHQIYFLPRDRPLSGFSVHDAMHITLTNQHIAPLMISTLPQH